jgi:hypothetical protein
VENLKHSFQVCFIRTAPKSETPTMKLFTITIGLIALSSIETAPTPAPLDPVTLGVAGAFAAYSGFKAWKMKKDQKKQNERQEEAVRRISAQTQALSKVQNEQAALSQKQNENVLNRLYTTEVTVRDKVLKPSWDREATRA